MPELCCSILCPPGLEERVFDALLSGRPDDVFFSSPVSGHGVAHGTLRADERVDGRARGVLVQILLPAPEWVRLRSALHEDFAGSGLRYWATPLHDEGVCA